MQKKKAQELIFIITKKKKSCDVTLIHTQEKQSLAN